MSKEQDAAQRTVMGKESYNFDLICEDGSFVGDIFYWESEDFIYVEHFCIVPDMRGGGLGKRALEHARQIGENGNSRDRSSGGQRVGTPPRFLSPCGIQDEFHRTHSSSVRKEYDGHRLKVMSFPRELSETEYENFASFLRNTVMKDLP